MSTTIVFRLTLDTEYGCLEGVPLQCVVHHECDGPIPQVAWVHGLRLSVTQIHSMVGTEEWDRQMVLMDEWWSERGNAEIREQQQHHLQRMATE